MLSVPVERVLAVDALFLGLELADVVSAVVENGVIAGRQAEIRAFFTQEITVDRHEADIGGHGQEVGHGAGQLVLQGVVVHCLHADGVPLRLGGGFFARLGGRRAVKVFFGSGDDGVQDVRGGGRVLRVQYISRRVHKVLRLQLGHGLGLAVDPLHALAQVEGPGQAVLRHFPGLRQGRLYLPQVIVLDQGIDNVGRDRKLIGTGSNQIVQGGCLAGIEHPVGALFGRKGRRHAHQEQCRQNQGK